MEFKAEKITLESSLTWKLQKGTTVNLFMNMN
jgi:hypothetical protein